MASAKLYMADDSFDRVDPSSPMGYVGSLSEIEGAIAMEQQRLKSSPGRKGGKRGQRGAKQTKATRADATVSHYPTLDKQRALRGLESAALGPSSSAPSSSFAPASMSQGSRRKPRRRPASAGRMRHSASAPLWHTSVMEKKSGGRGRRRHRRRPASAGRTRKSASAGILTSMTNNLQYGSGAGTLGNGSGRRRVRLREMRERAKKLEQGWNQTFAQNLVSNKMIMASKDEIGSSRRRDWMDHHAAQFSALNELRRAILKSREGGGRRRVRVSKSSARSKSKKRVVQKIAKKKRKKRPSSKKLTLVEKTRMQTRRLQRDNGASSAPQLSPTDADEGIGKAGDDGSRDERHSDYEDSEEDFEDDEDEDASAKDRHLSEMHFVKQCKAVRVLFEELKVPQRDRRFFTKNFMARYDKRSASFVQEQAELLEGHRRRTLLVLSRIRRREMAIKQLHAVAKACVSGIVAGVESKTVSSNDAGSEIDSMKVDHRKRFRAILEDAARRAQTASCLVVEAIVLWRKDLWRPQPFHWKGKNYILRMGNCVGLQKFVTNTDYVRAIRMCELPPGTLDVLLPSNVCEELCVGKKAARENGGDGEGQKNGGKSSDAAAGPTSSSPAGDWKE